MTAQTPKVNTDLDGSKSWGFVYANGFDYITQRPVNNPGMETDDSGGEMMVGGGAYQSPLKGLDEVGVWCDDKRSLAISAYLNGILPCVLRSVDARAGIPVTHSWSGTMGYTSDVMPLVGRLTPKLTHRRGQISRKVSSQAQRTVQPSEWISAGFNGDGMTSAWLSGTAVASMILGRENADRVDIPGRPTGRVLDWLPKELLCSPERVSKASIYDFAELIE
jgi:glycine/D-amino acid oxidase-like deaminating enzyme